MKTVQTLLNANRNMKAGNHKFVQGEYTRKFVYFKTVICEVNDMKRTFSIDDSYGSVSTTRACNAYRRELESQGYREVELLTI